MATFLQNVSYKNDIFEEDSSLKTFSIISELESQHIAPKKPPKLNLGNLLPPKISIEPEQHDAKKDTLLPSSPTNRCDSRK